MSELTAISNALPGHDDHELFLIRRGTVKLMVPIRKKDLYHMATSGPGEIIGGMGLMEATSHAADALAMTDVEVYALTREKFEVLVADHPHLHRRIVESVARSLSSRLRTTIGELQALRG